MTLTFKINQEVNVSIRKAIASRFDGGSIMEIDYAQLEFRTAVFLAQDKQGMKDIENGVDVHQYTADIIGCSRQDAKAHTFKPLWGMSGTENEKYYSAFLKKYPDVKAWHEKLQDDALDQNWLRYQVVAGMHFLKQKECLGAVLVSLHR